ncbi:MAG: hypothetical protein K1X47_04165 [Cyclobacteriaceae bacterium]|nr:hypothetical protein [Cyclobacteriaceae bacterium]
MKHTILVCLVALLAAGCASNPFGSRVKEPFSGSSYESNNRFLRAVGKGVSSADNIAVSKADIEAKTLLAGQLNSTVKQVADQYLGQTQNERAADVADKFQSLSRQVMDTDLADVRKIGQQKYYNEKTKQFTVFIAYEIKKNAMFRFLKKQARVEALQGKLNDKQREVIEQMLDEQIKATEDN